MPSESGGKIDLATLRRLKAERKKFAMLTAYDYPTAAAAQDAGVHVLLVGDSMGCVLLGHPNTRGVPLELMVILAEAVRRGAPDAYVVGDLPFEAMRDGATSALAASRRFRDEAGCDAVKFEAASDQADIVSALAGDGFETIAHLGLRPQGVLTPDGYRATARDVDAIGLLVADARNMVAAGAAIVLLEAVSVEAAAAVVDAVDVPVIGCGAGPACDAHVVVTQDMLGFGGIQPPRFVPVMANVGETMRSAMRQWVLAIENKTYPGREHVYRMKKPAAADR